MLYWVLLVLGIWLFLALFFWAFLYAYGEYEDSVRSAQ